MTDPMGDTRFPEMSCVLVRNVGATKDALSVEKLERTHTPALVAADDSTYTHTGKKFKTYLDSQVKQSTTQIYLMVFEVT